MLSEYSTQGLQTVNGRKKSAIVRFTNALYPRMWSIKKRYVVGEQSRSQGALSFSRPGRKRRESLGKRLDRRQAKGDDVIVTGDASQIIAHRLGP